MTIPPTMAISFLLFFRFLFPSCVTTSYTPEDNIAVNCGGSGNSFIGGQNWTGDIDFEPFSPIEFPNSNESSVSAKATKALGVEIPFNTARLSRSQFSYSFPVNVGQKFVRLYFYPSFYGLNFLRSDSLFSVSVGSHTLLKDFNASLNADRGVSFNSAATDGAIVLEYCVNIGDVSEGIRITFMRSLSHPNSYAFVNGIEVVSMPTFLYYTNPEDLQAMMLDGGNQQFPVHNNSALETLYRINVGGRKILSYSDAGMFRSWDPDSDYLERERPLSVSAGFALQVDHRDYPNYTAPDEVYLTARNYGMNETSKFNVTWEFEVDSQFVYMVRLHLCEFDLQIEKAGERVFQIFINDALVESIADVMIWTESHTLVPVHRDYAVSMPSNGSSKKLTLSIKLQPHPTARSTYRDVLLNGIEILKISDFRNNLGGPNPDPLAFPAVPPSKASNKNPPKIRVISIVVGSASGFILLSLIVLLTYCRLAKAVIKEGNSQWGPKPESSSKTNKSSLLTSNLCRIFSLSEVRAATNNFDDSLIIGVGEFGHVYKGHIDNSSYPVANGSNKVHNKGSKSSKLRLKCSLNFVTII